MNTMKNIFGSNLCQAYSLKKCGKSTTWGVAPSYYVTGFQPEKERGFIYLGRCPKLLCYRLSA